MADDNQLQKYIPSIIFDYGGVAVVEPDHDGHFKYPNFKPIASLTTSDVVEPFRQDPDRRRPVVIQHNLEDEDKNVRLLFGTQCVSGLRRWMMSMKEAKTVAAEGRNYDSADSYLTVRELPFRILTDVDAFVRLNADYRTEWEAKGIPEAFQDVEPRVPQQMLASVVFKPVTELNCRQPEWSGDQVRVGYTVVEDVVQLWGFTLDTFVGLLPGHDVNVNTVFTIKHDGLPYKTIDIAGVEGWRGWLDHLAGELRTVHATWPTCTVSIWRRLEQRWGFGQGIIISYQGY